MTATNRTIESIYHFYKQIFCMYLSLVCSSMCLSVAVSFTLLFFSYPHVHFLSISLALWVNHIQCLQNVISVARVMWMWRDIEKHSSFIESTNKRDCKGKLSSHKYVNICDGKRRAVNRHCNWSLMENYYQENKMRGGAGEKIGKNRRERERWKQRANSER